MKVYDSKSIRNVVLVGHSGSGKTSLAEAMLYESGATTRIGSVDTQNTVSDFHELEHERGNSVFSSLMTAEWKDSKINLIDTPGFDDFVGEVVSSLKVADVATMVLNAQNGVEVGTELIWEYIEKESKPTIFVVNQIDQDQADFDRTIEQAKGRFGNKVMVIQYPLNQGNGFNAVIDVLKMTMYEFPPEGGKPTKKPIPEDEEGRASELHNALVEAAAENDEALMEKYFEDGSLTEEEMAQGIKLGLINRDLYPVFIASSTKNMGSGRVMGFIHDICPAPAEMPAGITEAGDEIVCDPNGPTSLFIFKTQSEQSVGNMSHFKVYSGTVKTGMDLQNVQTSTGERFNQLGTAHGKTRNQVDELQAGDIGLTVKLKNSHTNQTLNAKGTNWKIDPIHFPSSRIRVAVKPPSKADLEKLAVALHAIQEEDPTLIVEQSQELKQTIIHGQGEMHLDVIKWKVSHNYKLDLEFEKPRIPYRETITKEANTIYRHKKQSGGSGQFGEVHMRIEPYYEGMADPAGLTVRGRDEHPLPWGGKLVYYNCIVGGAIDAKFHPSILKGIMQKMEDGPLTGSYCRDIRVCIYDGKMHPVDSNDMAFQLAGMMAFRTAFKEAAPKLMEPIFDVEVLVDGDAMGDVMSDLQGRRAIIQGMDADGHYQKIKAKVPLAEMYKYSSTLRSITQGKAKFTMEFAEYAQVPMDVQQQLVSSHTEELAEV